MERIPFRPDRIRVGPGTADAWTALAAVMEHHGYTIRTTDTDSYNCREAKGASGQGDLENARQLINGGTHGFGRFKDAYDRGRRAL
jgi:hypothetical protein